MTKRKATKPPIKSGGFSYKNIVRKKDSKGRIYYLETSEDKKKKRVSKEAYQKVQETKKLLKTNYGKEWRQKFKSHKTELKKINKKDKQLEKQKEVDLFKNASTTGEIETFGNSIASDMEEVYLDGFKIFIHWKRKQIPIKDDILSLRLMLSEIMDIFWERWKEVDEAAKEEEEKKKQNQNFKVRKSKKNTPNVMFKHQEFILKDKRRISYLYLDSTVFSFDENYFNKKISELVRNYFN